jgi:ubiquinol-cytochrome c reductase cytochrome c1 subunit
VPFRTLSDEGRAELPEDQVRAYAAQFSTSGIRRADGDTRPARAERPLPESGMETRPT